VQSLFGVYRPNYEVPLYEVQRDPRSSGPILTLKKYITAGEPRAKDSMTAVFSTVCNLVITVIFIYIGRQVIRQFIMHLFPVAGVIPGFVPQVSPDSRFIDS
jgi:hypothetical protein